MEYVKFQIWLQNEKGMSIRSSRDVVSRVKRVQVMLNSDDVSANTLEELNSSEDFLKCSMFVKSQLRRAVALYNEFF